MDLILLLTAEHHFHWFPYCPNTHTHFHRMAIPTGFCLVYFSCQMVLFQGLHWLDFCFELRSAVTYRSRPGSDHNTAWHVYWLAYSTVTYLSTLFYRYVIESRVTWMNTLQQGVQVLVPIHDQIFIEVPVCRVRIYHTIIITWISLVLPHRTIQVLRYFTTTAG